MKDTEFLEACGASYLNALAALGHFRSLVQLECRRVGEAKLPSLVQQLGYDLSDFRSLSHADPERPVAAHLEMADLGWKWTQAHFALHLTLYWTDDADFPRAAFTIWLKDRSKAETLWKKFEESGESDAFVDQPWNYDHRHANHFWFYLETKPGEFSQFSTTLNELLQFLIPVFEQFDDIQGLFQPSEQLRGAAQTRMLP